MIIEHLSWNYDCYVTEDRRFHAVCVEKPDQKLSPLRISNLKKKYNKLKKGQLMSSTACSTPCAPPMVAKYCPPTPPLPPAGGYQPWQLGMVELIDYAETQISLADCSMISAQCNAKPCPGNQEKEQTMQLYAENSIEQAQKNHLLARLQDTAGVKRNELRKAFFMDDDKAPATPKELADRFASGKFSLPKNADDSDAWTWSSLGEMARAITWRDPSSVKDSDGFNKANAAMKVAGKDAEDMIVLFDAETGHKALKDFTSKTFH